MWEFKSEIEIKKKVKESIEQSINGLEKESTKLDFKLKWYNLKEEKEVFEFIKDTTALVNTVGLDALIIIGYDEKRKIFQDAKITDSKRKATDINDIFSKRVSTFFDLNIYEFDNIEIKGANRVLSVIHIPIFLDKPVVIKGFKNFRQLDKNGNPRIEEQKIFVRKNSSNRPASKYDIDLMYYDRKNIIPDYRAFFNIINVIETQKPLSKKNKNNYSEILFYIFLENLGSRSLSLSHIELKCFVPIERRNPLEYLFSSSKLYRFDLSYKMTNKALPLSSLIINPNSANSFILEVEKVFSPSRREQFINKWNKENTTWEVVMYMVNGKQLVYRTRY